MCVAEWGNNVADVKLVRTEEQLQAELAEEQREKEELEGVLEAMRRAALLTKVYREFDLDGGGDVGEDELLELGQARRRLGQKEGEWTVENNRALMAAIGTDEEGVGGVVLW